MRIKIATKVTIAVAAALALAVLSSLSGLFAANHAAGVTETLMREYMDDARSITELEQSFLEQRGFVSAYILGGDPRWMAEINQHEPSFARWLERVRRMSRGAAEAEILAELDEVVEQYDRHRKQVVALCDGGQVNLAATLFLGEVNPLYNKVYHLCDKLDELCWQRMQAGIEDGRGELRRTTLWVAASVALTVALCIGLLWYFFQGILFPLRRMAAEYRASYAAAAGAGSTDDELREIGACMAALSSDVAEARTDLERSRRQLLVSEKLASVGLLAAGVAHEIRNPLTNVKMRLFALRRELGGEPQFDDDIRVMTDEIDRLEEVIRNFLEFSRPPEPKIGRHTLPEIVDRALELLRHRIDAATVRVAKVFPADLPQVMVDPDQMRQVVINLAVNAFDAMPEGGELRIEARAEAASDGRPMVALRIADTGSGVPAEARERVFEPFYSTKEQGVGLGLCIAARIVERHHGSISLETRSPQGAVFSVLLPAG